LLPYLKYHFQVLIFILTSGALHHTFSPERGGWFACKLGGEYKNTALITFLYLETLFVFVFQKI
jgi:hypothetical protein